MPREARAGSGGANTRLTSAIPALIVAVAACISTLTSCRFVVALVVQLYAKATTEGGEPIIVRALLITRPAPHGVATPAVSYTPSVPSTEDVTRANSGSASYIARTGQSMQRTPILGRVTPFNLRTSPQVITGPVMHTPAGPVIPCTTCLTWALPQRTSVCIATCARITRPA